MWLAQSSPCRRLQVVRLKQSKVIEHERSSCLSRVRLSSCVPEVFAYSILLIENVKSFARKAAYGSALVPQENIWMCNYQHPPLNSLTGRALKLTFIQKLALLMQHFHST